MKKILVLGSLAILAGCASNNTAAPNFIGGHYYLAGDPPCVKGKVVAERKIACADSESKVTGYRDAMTDQQLAMYQMAVSQQQMADQQAMANMQAQNAAWNQQMATRPQYPTMATPQVTPIQQPGGNQVRCISRGIYTNCRY